MKYPIREVASWMEFDSKDNSKATATRAAPDQAQRHYITSVAGSYDKTATDKTLILKDGTTEIGRWVVPDQNTLHIEFPSPVVLTTATAANLELDASGAGGTTGTAVLTGYTL